MASQPRQFSDFKEFWPYYLQEHAHPKTRAAHAIGTAVGLAATAAAAVLLSPLAIPLGIAGIYGALTMSHVVFQGNKPATFQHFTAKNALMAVRSDLTMIGMWFAGRIKGEYKRLGLDPNAGMRAKAPSGTAKAKKNLPAAEPKAKTAPAAGAAFAKAGNAVKNNGGTAPPALVARRRAVPAPVL